MKAGLPQSPQEPAAADVGQSAPSVTRAHSDPHLFKRAGTLVAVLVIELSVLSIWFNTGTLRGARGLTALVADWGPAGMRLLVASILVALVLGSNSASRFKQLSTCVVTHRVSWRLLLSHAGMALLFVWLSTALSADRSQAPLNDTLVGLWAVAAVAAFALAALAFMPMRFWVQLLRTIGDVLIFALVVTIGAYAFGEITLALWPSLSRGTLRIAFAIVRLFVPSVTMNPSTLVIGSPEFQIEVARSCSGCEGLGMILVFTAAWLWFHRADWRFPHALVLFPIGMASIWIFNCLRIAALVLIGIGGAPQVALGGFHSQAGWLGFNAVALGICLVARHAPSLTIGGVDTRSRSATTPNPVAPYLIPFLAIVAGSMVSQLGSAGFEWLYPVRVFACAAALWYFRTSYRALDWRIGWTSIGLGCLAFVIWIGLEPLGLAEARVGMPPALMQASDPSRMTWLTFRVLGGVITVPIAEELAFRGYLLRRFVAGDFESVGWQSAPWTVVLLSSVVYAALHGDRWLAGTVAGVIYAMALRRRGSLGDAIVAHATTNALLAATVLIGGYWQLW